MSAASFRATLAWTHAPIFVFAVLVTGLTVVVLGLAEASAQRLDLLRLHGALRAEHIEEVLRAFRWVWLGCLAGFYAFAMGASRVLVHVDQQVTRRAETMIEYLKDRAEGRAPRRTPCPKGEDGLAMLERAVLEVAERVGERERNERRLSQRTSFDARVQRALGLADTEEEVAALVLRSLGGEDGHHRVELLLADSSEAHLRKAGGPAEDAARCPVVAPRACAAVRRGRTLDFPSSEALDACPKLRGRVEGPTSAICSPITVMGQTIGVVHITGAEGRMVAQDELDTVESVVTHAGSRLSALRTLSTSEMQAHTDALTGLPNRRSFIASVAARRRSAPMAQGVLVMADIDHFKQLNDGHGHDAGDRALRLFGALLRSSLRERDRVGRLGGEEFAILLQDCSTDDAVRRLGELRGRLADTLLRAAAPTFTVSFGLAELDGVSELEDLLARADARLYEAKKAGRDCIAGPAPGRIHRGVELVTVMEGRGPSPSPAGVQPGAQRSPGATAR